MKMNLFDKFLLALMLLLLLAISLFLGCVAVSVIAPNMVTSYLDALIENWSINAYFVAGIALALFIITIRLFVASYSSGKDANYMRLVVTENGEIAISIPTIKQITAAFIATKPEILASASVILPIRDGLIVRVHVCPKEGTMLPDATRSLQKELKAHLEMVTGLTIKEIGVLVDTNRANYSGKGR